MAQAIASIVTNWLLQLTGAPWRSCCSRREAAESSKQRRPGHLSAVQMCLRQTAIKVFLLAACPTAHPVQNSGHHTQGSVAVNVPCQTENILFTVAYQYS